MTLDEVIAHARSDEEFFRRKVETDCVTGRTYLHPFCEYIKRAEEQKHLAEWLEKLQYIENIILKWNADFYNDEDTGIPDNEILEAIFNACNDNGFDIPIDEDFKKGYNKAIDDAKNVVLQTLDNEMLVDTLHLRLEQLKEGVDNDD